MMKVIEVLLPPCACRGTKHVFFYAAFGRRVVSERALVSVASASESSTEATLNVFFSQCQDPIPDHWLCDAGFYRYNDDEFMCDVPEVARFRVRDNNIWVESTARTLRDCGRLVEAHLFGPVVAAALQRQQCLTFHASAVVMGRRAVMLSGCPSGGKSTLAYALSRRGAQPLSDDLCVLTRTPSGLICWPGVDHIKLMPDILAHFSVASADTDSVGDEVGKRAYPLTSGGLLPEKAAAAPVSDVIFLERAADVPAKLTPLRGSDKFDKLLQQVFRPQFLPAPAQSFVLGMLIHCAQQVRVWQLDLPTRLDRLDGVMDLLEEHCGTAPS